MYPNLKIRNLTSKCYPISKHPQPNYNKTQAYWWTTKTLNICTQSGSQAHTLNPTSRKIAAELWSNSKTEPVAWCNLNDFDSTLFLRFQKNFCSTKTSRKTLCLGNFRKKVVAGWKEARDKTRLLFMSWVSRSFAAICLREIKMTRGA